MSMLSASTRLTTVFRLVSEFSHRSYASLSTAARIAPLPHRSVLEISGPDAQKFLKGQTCKDVEGLGGGYSGFLGATGRVLHTVFILPVPNAAVPTYLITHENSPNHPAPLLTHLPPFKLRSRVKLKDVSSQWDVWAAWGDPDHNGSDDPIPLRRFKFGSGGAAEVQWSWEDGPRSTGLSEGEIGCWDLRAGFGFGGMGRHILVPKGTKPSLATSHDTGATGDYHLRRMLLGVPEGSQEIIPGTALPLESCMDIQGGVDFRKGCYLGQELTVRTYHTGMTRKRILPIQLRPTISSASGSPSQSPQIPPEAFSSGIDITYHPPASAASKKARSAGKLLSLHEGVTSVGLGLVRLEMVERSCWNKGEDPGKLTVNIGGQDWEVSAEKGEAYAASLKAAEELVREEAEEREA